MIKNQVLVDMPAPRVGDHAELLAGRGRNVSYREKQRSNCSGMVQNSNCGGDPLWNPLNGNWWTWPGIGGSSTNRTAGTMIGGIYNPSYDFAGGQQTTNTPLATYNSRIYSSYTLVESRGDQDIYERTWQNCNCGPNNTTYANCYSNCNCNCNCNCACCNCG